MYQIQTNDKNNLLNRNRKTNRKWLVFLVLLVLVFAICVFLFKDKVFTSQIENKNVTFDENAVLSEDSKKNLETDYPEKEENTEPVDFILDKLAKANDLERKSDLREIIIALVMYFNDNDKYPLSDDAIKLNDKNSAIYKEFLIYLTEESLKDPKDPEFYYTYRSNGYFYELSARLENLGDKECKIINNLCIYTIDSGRDMGG